MDVDANGNAQASVSTSNNVADALVAVGESVKNTANAAVKYDDASNKAQLTLNPGGQAARLSNVQAGALTASSTDAVNGSQLSSSNERIGQLGTQVGELATRTGNDIAAAKAYTDANVVTVRQSIEAVQDVATQTAQAAVKYDDASNKAQLTLNPGGQAARLSNVQAGALTASSTDAVNGSQLSSSNERIGQLGTQLGELATRTGNDIAAAKAYTDANVVTVRQSIEAVQGVATQNAQSVSKVSAEVANLQKGAGGAFQTSARSNLRQPQASGKDAVAGGGAAQAAGDNSVAMGARARAEGSGTTAVGSDAKAIASNSVALGANSVADRSNTVSVGQAGTERQITNVAAGSRGTDAANISQLTRATAAATEQANAYTDQRYAQLHRDLKQQDSTLSAGIAGAMAMANLPRSTVAGGSMTSVAVGNYRGESALAVGVSYVSPSGRWSTNFSGSTNTRNDAGAAVGVGYQW
ncbi:YadA family autotransporter adhesin [Pseudomonas putida]|uniref:YadA family autotransporter adhesin n=1 Tax=Pseudomonas putida TaxID=303 RepID=UPI0013AEB70F|nr:YadA-like family protein [Pseudomonas putida]